LRRPFRQALQLAGQLGVDAIEIDARHDVQPRELSQTGVRQLRKMLNDTNLRVAAVRFLARRGYHVLDELDRRIAATKEAMQFAYALGAPVVVTRIGPIPTEDEAPERGLLLEVLRDLGAWSHRSGALLAAITGRQSGAELARLIEALPEGTLGAAIDPAALVLAGHGPAEAVAALGPSILHVYANDATEDPAQGRGVSVPLGRGSVEMPELLGALEEQGYRGYLCLDSAVSDDPMHEAANAVQYLRALARSG